MKKQDAIAEELKQRIRAGVYPPDVRMPSESELADELGVNKITVNKAVNRLIAEGGIRRGKSSRDGTYACDPAQTLRGRIGILIRLGNSYSSQLLYGLCDGASRHGYLPSVLLPTPEELPRAVNKMMAGGLQGLFIVGYSEIRLRDVPAVYIDCGLYSGKNTLCISADVYTGSREMAVALLEAGHREIAFCMYSSFPVAENPRCAAFLDVMREYGVPNPEKRFFYTNHTSSARMLRKIFSRFPETSVIVGGNDQLTHQLYCAFSPKDPPRESITFAGFGNLTEIQMLHPFVTVDQHSYEIGIRAVERLAEGRSIEGIEHTPTSLVHRELITPH